MAVFLLVVGLLLFIGLVIVHEYGHFLVARRNGVEVEEFGIGFPPRAWSKKMKGGFILSLNWLPIGGFVRLKGESDAATEPGSLGAASINAKAKIMLAGVAMNLLVAYALLTVLAVLGMPRFVENQFTVASDTRITRNDVLVGYVEPRSPAAQAGLQLRDRLIAIGEGAQNDPIAEAAKLPGLTEKYAGKTVKLTYARQGEQRETTLTLRSKAEVEASKDTAEPKGYMGVAPTELTLTRSTWSAPIVGAGLVWQFTKATFQGLGTMIAAVFHGEGSRAAAQVSGPVGIVVLLRDGSMLGYQFVLMLIAIISLTLAIMNALPVPALDGGRLYMMLLSRLSGRKMSREMEERIVGASFLFLLFLIVMVTIVDVRRFF